MLVDYLHPEARAQAERMMTPAQRERAEAAAEAAAAANAHHLLCGWSGELQGELDHLISPVSMEGAGTMEGAASPAARSAPAGGHESVLGKRPRHNGGGPASGLRGVSLHSRTRRMEAHVWNGKQVFLGSFTEPQQAALCHDLAAVLLRGQDANTNLPIDLYGQELALAATGQIGFDFLVQHLRAQARVQGMPPANVQALAMAPWELQLSEAVSGCTSLGVFSSEAEAARAADRALLARDGLEAADLLNFPLQDYLACLDEAQVEEARRTGLLPQTEQRTVDAAAAGAAAASPRLAAPAGQAGMAPTDPHQLPAAEQLPLLYPPVEMAPQQQAEQQLLSPTPASTAVSREEGAQLAPPLPLALAQRKASLTPRPAPIDDGAFGFL